MAKDTIQRQLDSMSEEDKAELLQSFKKSKKLVSSSLSLEEQAGGVWAYKKITGPSEAAKAKFDVLLAFMMAKKAKWSYIPFWMMEIAYHWIQERDNPFAKPWSMYQIRAYIRIWMVRNGNHWCEWSQSVGRRKWYTNAKGARRIAGGYGKNNPKWCPLKDCFPVNVMTIDKGGPVYANQQWVFQQEYGRTHFQDIFEELGIL